MGIFVFYQFGGVARHPPGVKCLQKLIEINNIDAATRLKTLVLNVSFTKRRYSFTVVSIHEDMLSILLEKIIPASEIRIPVQSYCSIRMHRAPYPIGHDDFASHYFCGLFYKWHTVASRL